MDLYISRVDLYILLKANLYIFRVDLYITQSGLIFILYLHINLTAKIYIVSVFLLISTLVFYRWCVPSRRGQCGRNCTYI